MVGKARGVAPAADSSWHATGATKIKNTVEAPGHRPNKGPRARIGQIKKNRGRPLARSGQAVGARGRPAKSAFGLLRVDALGATRRPGHRPSISRPSASFRACGAIPSRAAVVAAGAGKASEADARRGEPSKARPGAFHGFFLFCLFGPWALYLAYGLGPPRFFCLS